MSEIQLIHLKGCPIFKQLQLEEALLRAHNQNFCLINEGSSQQAVVMGISSPVEDHLDKKKILNKGIPVIKRFSGGGTVVVDHNTYFVSFIFNKKALDISPFPEPILRWSEQFYKGVFPSDFALRENDYVFKDKKFGGNAKYIQKERWLLHTSFLWDYSQENMDLLHNPSKAPKYRKNRSHMDFLTPLNLKYSSMEEISKGVYRELEKNFSVSKVLKEYPDHYLAAPHRESTSYLTLN